MNTAPKESILLTAALAYAKKGWAIFPCAPENKKPLIKDWPNAATTDPEQITAWWKRSPQAMIGVPTGPRSGLYVLDIDIAADAGKDGRKAYAELLAKAGLKPEDIQTLEASTPRGGKHLFFNYPDLPEGERLINSASQLGPDLDTRGQGGYVILAPSRAQDGRGYVWTADLPPADIPAALLALLPRSGHTAGHRPPLALVRSGPSASAWGQAALDRICRELAATPQGHRNDKLNSSALRLGRIAAGGNLSISDIEPALTAAMIAAGETNMRAVRGTIESALAKAREEGPAYPPEISAAKPPAPTPWPDEEPMPEEIKTNRRPLEGLDPDKFTALACLEGAKPYQWFFKDSFLSHSIGLLCGPPGSGKGLMSVQMAVAAAAGVKLYDQWEPVEPSRVIYISAEDAAEVLHNRFHFALEKLPDDLREETAGRICVLPVAGRVNICVQRSDEILPAETLTDLVALVEAWKPKLIVLDTWAKFAGIDENRNEQMTAALGLVEALASEFRTNILLIHHTNKAGGDLVNKPEELERALNQASIRGASAIAGSIRWALMLAPLGADLADKIIGSDANGKPPGTYCVARVGKKNAGPSEDRIYLEKVAGNHGLFDRVDVINNAYTDATKLLDEVNRRHEAGLAPLSAARGARDILAAGKGRVDEAVDFGVTAGWFVKTKRDGVGGGWVLTLPDGYRDERTDDDQFFN